MKSPYSVVIVDDHPIFRQGLKNIINHSKQWHVVAEAGTADNALTLYRQYQPSIIVLDIHLPDKSGLTVAEEILKDDPAANCVMMTMYRETAYYQHALGLGVKGYLLKEDAAEDILSCFSQVVKDVTFVSERMEASGIEKASKDEVFIHPEEVLTKRELAVLKSIAELKVNKTIAIELNISLNTVQNHRQNMCHKLKLNGRQALLRYAVKWKNKKLHNSLYQ